MRYKLRKIISYITVVAFCLSLSTVLYCGNFQGTGGNSSGTTPTSATGSDSTAGGSKTSSSSTSSGSKMTIQDARDQAESEIPQPPAVYDVTDSALVYSQLKPYVDKWRATLPVPTNQWGVDTSSAVVQSSTRPDFVPAKLITFIMGEFAKEGKAGAFGLDGAAETRKNLEDARKDAVDKRANEILDKANKEAASEQAASDNSSEADSSDADSSDTDSSDTDSTKNSSSEETSSVNEENDPEPDKLDSTPITEESEHAAGIDTDLDGKPDGLDDKDSKADVSAEHRASYLLDGSTTRVMNLLTPKLNKINEVISRLKANGDNTVYLYLCNLSDGEGSGYTTYNDDDIGMTINDSRVKEYRSKIELCKAAGLNIIFWLRPDDSSWFINRPTAQQNQYQTDMVQLFDKDAAGWVIGYKTDEYMSEADTKGYVSQLKGITSKHVGIHCRDLENCVWATSSGADVFYGDYGFSCSVEDMTDKTKSVVEKLDGSAILVAVGYHRNSDSDAAKALGKAAIEAGAKGTGNGR